MNVEKLLPEQLCCEIDENEGKSSQKGYFFTIFTWIFSSKKGYIFFLCVLLAAEKAVIPPVSASLPVSQGNSN